MIVVSNSSPLITLSRVRQLDLLREFYGQILIPLAVYEEVAVAGAGLPGAAEVRAADWIQTQQVPSEPSELLKSLCVGLGEGERSAICLASTVGAQLVLIDEARARRAAKGGGLPVAGSLAVLERGARLHKIGDLRSLYLRLLEEGIYFNRSLLDESLARLGLAKLGG